MKLQIKRIIGLLFFLPGVFLRVNAQQAADNLVLQTFHSGFSVLDFDLNAAGTRMASVGEDKTILLYDLPMRVIYQRINLPDSVSCKHVAIDSAGERLITLENSRLVFRNLNSTKIWKTVNLKRILDSLKYNNIDDYFLKNLPETNELVLLAGRKTLNSYQINEWALLVFNAHTGRLEKISPAFKPETYTINDFYVNGSDFFILSTQQGLLAYKKNNPVPEQLWKPDSGNVPASMAFCPAGVWVLTTKNLFLLDKTSGIILKNFTRPLETNTILIRHHPLTTDALSNAYVYNSDTRKLEIFSATGTTTFDSAPETYIPQKIKVVQAKNYLLLADKSTLSVFDLQQKALLLKLENPLARFEHFQFFKPGAAYVTTQEAFLQVDFTKGLVTRFSAADKDLYHPEQLVQLPFSNLIAVNNGLYVKFLDAQQHDFKFGIGIPKKTFTASDDTDLNWGSTKGESAVYFSQDEKIMVSALNSGLGVLVWDLENKKLLRQIDLKPLHQPDKGKTQQIDYLTFHKKEKLIYLETSDNYLGNEEFLVINALTGKILVQEEKKFPGKFHGCFFPDHKKLLTPGPEWRTTTLLDLATNQRAIIPYSMEKPVISLDEQQTFYLKNDTVYRYNFNSRTQQLIGTQAGVEEIVLNPSGENIITLDRNNIIKAWNPKISELLFTLYIQVPPLKAEPPAYVFVSPDFYYMGGGNFSNLILLNKNGRIIPFEQFDQVYNRPDLVLSKIGEAAPELIAGLKKVTARRANTAPKIPLSFKAEIQNKASFRLQASQPFITLKCRALNAANPVTGFRVWLNGVALMADKPKMVTPEMAKAGLLEKIKLTEKTNRIEVAFLDNKGEESMRDLLVIDLAAAPKPNLWLVGLGVANYQNTAYNLRYSAKDVADVVNFLKTARAFQQVNTLFLKDEQVTKAALPQITQFLADAKPEDIAMIFYAGHGLLDKQLQYFLASHNIDFSAPEVNGIAVTAIEQALTHSQARKKIMLIDACHSGLVEEPENINLNTTAAQKNVKQTGRGVEIRNNQTNYGGSEVIQSAFLNLDKGAGLTIIAASSGAELAYEDSQVQNGLFTYAFLEGIKSGNADLNQNKAISLSEIKNYVEQRVLTLSNGKQRPTNRRWNSYQDFPLWYSSDQTDQQLIDAISRNDTASISLFLKNGYPINVKGQFGFTPLHYAARDNKLDALKLLVKNGADLNASPGNTPLYLAVINNQIPAAYYLIISGALVKDQLFFFESKGKLTLAQIAREKKFNQLGDILEQAETLKKQDATFRALYGAITSTNLQALESKLKTEQVNVNFIYPEVGYPLLYIAIAAKSPEIVSYLLGKGAQVKNIPYTTFSPLHLAANAGNEEIINLLLQAGANKLETDRNGNLPVTFIPENAPNAAVLKKLLE